MIEGNENNDLENLEELDDITAVDLALKLSEYDDDELEEFLKKPTEEELAGILDAFFASGGRAAAGYPAGWAKLF